MTIVGIRSSRSSEGAVNEARDGVRATKVTGGLRLMFGSGFLGLSTKALVLSAGMGGRYLTVPL